MLPGTSGYDASLATSNIVVRQGREKRRQLNGRLLRQSSVDMATMLHKQQLHDITSEYDGHSSLITLLYLAENRDSFIHVARTFDAHLLCTHDDLIFYIGRKYNLAQRYDRSTITIKLIDMFILK